MNSILEWKLFSPSSSSYQVFLYSLLKITGGEDTWCWMKLHQVMSTQTISNLCMQTYMIWSIKSRTMSCTCSMSMNYTLLTISSHLQSLPAPLPSSWSCLFSILLRYTSPVFMHAIIRSSGQCITQIPIMTVQFPRMAKEKTVKRRWMKK